LKFKLGITGEEEGKENISDILKERYLDLPPIEQYRISLWLRALSQRRKARLEQLERQSIIDDAMETEHKFLESKFDLAVDRDRPDLVPSPREPDILSEDLEETNSDSKTGHDQSTTETPDSVTTISGSTTDRKKDKGPMEPEIAEIPREAAENTTEANATSATTTVIAHNETSSIREPTQNQTSANAKALENFLELPTTWTAPTVELNTGVRSSHATPTASQRQQSVTTPGPLNEGTTSP